MLEFEDKPWILMMSQNSKTRSFLKYSRTAQAIYFKAGFFFLNLKVKILFLVPYICLRYKIC